MLKIIIATTVLVGLVPFGVAARDSVDAANAANASSSEISRTAHVTYDAAFWSWKTVSLRGDSVNMAKFKGRYVLLNFWGEWCPKCREEIPFLRKLQARYGSDRLVIIGMLKSADQVKAKAMAADSGMTWTQVEMTPAMERGFHIEKFPTNLLLSPEGAIVMDGFSGHWKDFLRCMNEKSTIKQTSIR